MDVAGVTYSFGDIKVDPGARRVVRQGVDLDLEPKAFAVLVALLESAGKALARDDLLDQVWGHRHVTPGVLNRVVGHLRKALGDDAENPRYIQTLHGVGYRFLAEVERIPARSGHFAPLGASTSPSAADQPLPTAPDAGASAVAGGRRATDKAAASAAAAEDLIAPRRRIGLTSSLLVLGLGVLIAGLVVFLIQRGDSQSTRPAASIAVLPFTNLGGADNGYFVDGLTEEMRSALSSVAGLKVAASITPAVREASGDAKALGEKLGVATVLEASVRREGDALRISARLSDTRTGFTVWSETFDRRLLDVFDTQSRIANEVVESLLGVLPAERDALRKRLSPTENVEAFDDYLEGLQLLRQAKAADSDQQAIARFDHALQKDSGFARAQAGICLAEIRNFENLHSATAYENARIACQRALNMDSSLAEVSIALGDLYRVQGQLDQAIVEFKHAASDPATAVESNIGLAKIYALKKQPEQVKEYFANALAISPNDPLVHAAIGYQHYLDGQLKPAIGAYRKAVELAPDNADLWIALGGLLGASGNTADAEQALQRSIAIEPRYSALTDLGFIRFQAGDFAESVKLQRRALALNPTDFMAWANLGMALNAQATTQHEAHEAFEQAATRAQQYVDINSDDARAIAALGLYRAILGDKELALALVHRAERLQVHEAEVAMFNAETFARLGDIKAARERIARARQLGVPESAISSNAVFRRLGLLDSKGGEQQSQ